MYKNTSKQRSYEHRLKELVRSTGNIDVALQGGVSRSTAQGWLSKNMSDVITFDVLEKNLVAFYVGQYNTHLPYSSLQGQTPDEMYYGTGQEIPGQLQEARIAAGKSRMESNRSYSYRRCEENLTVSN